MRRLGFCLIFISMFSTLYSQVLNFPIRSRNVALVDIISSNTVGRGDLWVSGAMRGFIWDNSGELFIFPSYRLEYGLYEFLQFSVSGDPLYHQFLPGNNYLSIKVTDNNNHLRIAGVGIELSLAYPALAKSPNTGFEGFKPEGFIFPSAFFKLKGAFDLDFIKIYSFLPVRLYLNGAFVRAFNRLYNDFDQVEGGVGLEVQSVRTDFFVEFYAKMFDNFFQPRRFEIPIGKKEKLHKFEINFKENIFLFSPGFRVNYNRAQIFGVIQLSLSENVGSSVGGKTDDQDKAKGLSDGYFPFNPNWKIMGGMTIALRFHETQSEVLRTLMMMKSQVLMRKLDIDKKIEVMGTEEKKQLSEEEIRQKKLKELEDKRHQLEKEAEEGELLK